MGRLSNESNGRLTHDTIHRYELAHLITGVALEACSTYVDVPSACKVGLSIIVCVKQMAYSVEEYLEFITELTKHVVSQYKKYTVAIERKY